MSVIWVLLILWKQLQIISHELFLDKVSKILVDDSENSNGRTSIAVDA